MMKIKGSVLIMILMLVLVGCSKAEQDQLTVYSFNGENEQFTISNGVIVLHNTEEFFDGGDFKITDDLFNNITSYSTTFYMMSGDKKDVILSNSVADMRGQTVNISSDLGQISGDTTISRIKKDSISDLEKSFYFDLTTIDKDGEETIYTLQLSLTKITQ